jgi:hypothetical protein
MVFKNFFGSSKVCQIPQNDGKCGGTWILVKLFSCRMERSLTEYQSQERGLIRKP